MKSYITQLLAIYTLTPEAGRGVERRKRALLEISLREAPLTNHRAALLRSAVFAIWAMMGVVPQTVEEAAEALIAPAGMDGVSLKKLGWDHQYWSHLFHWSYMDVESGKVDPTNRNSDYFPYGVVVECLDRISAEALDACHAQDREVLAAMMAA